MRNGREPASRLIASNGVDATRGGYFHPVLTLEAWARHTLPEEHVREETPDVLRRARQIKAGARELVDGRNEELLSEAGWGVVFPRDGVPAIRAALSDLLDLREGEATGCEPLFRVFEGEDGVLPNETKAEWLERHGAGPGAVEPSRVPYYLLLVGAPEEIPFTFQYQLDLRYAVGRLHFDHVAGYRAYAQTVCARAARQESASPPRVALFGPRNPDDWCTAESSRWLIRELGERLREPHPRRWRVETYEGEQATKVQLTRLLRRLDSPEILFCSCHGLMYSSGDPLQRRRQGALVCQEWQGPLRSEGVLASDCFLAAEDLRSDACLKDGVAFLFSCFGAATPRWDESDHRHVSQQTERAPEGFIASLPSRLMSEPEGGALAVIAHVGQVFPQYNGAGHLKTFADILGRLMDGSPVGWAMEVMNRRYAELASDLHEMRERQNLGFGPQVSLEELFDLWTATNDSRGFVILGDPAVRVAPPWRVVS